MLNFFILLTLTAACTANVGELTVESLDQGDLRFTVACGAGSESPMISIEKASGTRFYSLLIQTSAGSTTCTGGTSRCAVIAFRNDITAVTYTTTGIGNTTNRWTFTRARSALTSDDVTLENGTHIFTTNVFNPSATNGSDFDTALGTGANEVKYTITITPFTGNPGFAYSLSGSGSTIFMTMTTQANKYAGLGFASGTNSYPVWALLCQNAIADCIAVECTSQVSCVTATTALTAQTRDATTQISTVERPTTGPSSLTISQGSQTKMLWLQRTQSGALSITKAESERASWSRFQTNPAIVGIPPRQSNPPTFGVTLEDAGSNQKRLSITTSRGKYAGIGVSSAALTSTSFPSTVAICEPVSLADCGIYTCSNAATCVVSTATVMQTRDADTRVSTITFTDSTFPTASSNQAVSQISDSQSVDIAFQTSSGTRTSNIYWYEALIPVTGLTLSPSLASSQPWVQWLASVTPLSAAPDFPISFTVPSTSTLGVSMTPGPGQTAMLGWRSSKSSTVPEDIVICAPSSVSTCLDVVCTSSTSCATRATTILTNNTASGASASFQRGFTAGDVKLTSGTPMWLAYNRVASPASTTTLSATAAQGVAWKFYDSFIDGTTSHSFSIIPTILSGIIALTYLL